MFLAVKFNEHFFYLQNTYTYIHFYSFFLIYLLGWWRQTCEPGKNKWRKQTKDQLAGGSLGLTGVTAATERFADPAGESGSVLGSEPMVLGFALAEFELTAKLGVRLLELPHALLPREAASRWRGGRGGCASRYLISTSSHLNPDSAVTVQRMSVQNGPNACSFLENCSYKQLHTRHCASLGPEQYTCHDIVPSHTQVTATHGQEHRWNTLCFTRKNRPR